MRRVDPALGEETGIRRRRPGNSASGPNETPRAGMKQPGCGKGMPPCALEDFTAEIHVMFAHQVWAINC